MIKEIKKIKTKELKGAACTTDGSRYLTAQINGEAALGLSHKSELV